jgi:hypothetical protein
MNNQNECYELFPESEAYDWYGNVQVLKFDSDTILYVYGSPLALIDKNNELIRLSRKMVSPAREGYLRFIQTHYDKKVSWREFNAMPCNEDLYQKYKDMLYCADPNDPNHTPLWATL